jgi:GNAT superfamily N-acetyltransferase
MLTIVELRPDDLARVDRDLPLNRLDQHLSSRSTYLVAWVDDAPVGHAHLAWDDTHLGLPEIQDVFVAPEHRRTGIATALTRAAEDAAHARGCARISLSVSREGNAAARSLYERLGYVDAAVEPVRVAGVITIRGRAVEVDDTLVYLVKSV